MGRGKRWGDGNWRRGFEANVKGSAYEANACGKQVDK
jgi:hypothetical protein